MPGLNTQVDGNEGLCEQAASWLDTVQSACVGAADKAISGRSLATSTWHGPAGTAFDDRTSAAPGALDDVAAGAQQAATAFREFSTGLQTIKSEMDRVRWIATSGGLEVDGPLIMAPTRPLSGAPCFQATAATPAASAQAQAINKQVDAYNQAVDAYNQKVVCYNACMRQVHDNRNAEARLHEQFENGLGALQRATQSPDAAAYVFTGASRARSLLGILENKRRAGMMLVRRFETTGAIYQKYADGGFPTPHEQAFYDKNAKFAKDNGETMARARQLDNIMRTIPANVRSRLTAYPFRKDIEGLGSHNPALEDGLTTKFWKGMGWASGGLTVISEGVDVARGKESLGKGATKASLEVVGGAGGSALGGAALGSVAGPPGALVGAILGGLGGSTFSGDVVDGFTDRTAEIQREHEIWKPLDTMGHQSRAR